MPISPVFLQMSAKSSEWLDDTMRFLGIEDERQGLHALRAGLHAVRDRMPAGDVVDLAAQLPTLIRGIYFEGWRLANDPAETRTRADLIARVRAELGSDHRLAPEMVARAVIRVLAWHVSGGEVDDILSTLPRKLATLVAEEPA